MPLQSSFSHWECSVRQHWQFSKFPSALQLKLPSHGLIGCDLKPVSRKFQIDQFATLGGGAMGKICWRSARFEVKLSSEMSMEVKQFKITYNWLWFQICRLKLWDPLQIESLHMNSSAKNWSSFSKPFEACDEKCKTASATSDCLGNWH